MDSITDKPSPEQTPASQVSQESIAYLVTAAKWGKFLAVFGFIMTGLMIVAGLFVGVALTIVQSDIMMEQDLPFPPSILTFIYLAVAVVLLIPNIYLNNFSNRIIHSTHPDHAGLVTPAFKALKNLFVSIGVITIVSLASYVVIILLAISTAALTF